MREQDAIKKQIKLLVWVYFWLLIFEGVLRKWIFPSFSAPLLVVRDPVVLAIYYHAFRAGIFPNNGFMKSLLIISGLSFVAGMVAMMLSDTGSVFVPLFGFHASFLHLPLVVVMPLVLNDADIGRFGRWIMILSVPIAILMVLQFRAPRTDWLNFAAGAEGTQLDSVGGKIRPAGPFSFVSGTVSYLALVTAFLVRGVLEKGINSPLLLLASGIALASSLAVSGSRASVYSAVLVVAMLGLGMIVNARQFIKVYKLALFALVIGAAAASFEFFEEGLETTTHRFEVANASESVIDRIATGFLAPFAVITEIPVIGYGLGAGTNVGTTIISGKATFALGEGEWSRVVLESGPILGLAYLVLRSALAIMLSRRAIASARSGRCLGLLLLGTCVVPLVAGQFGQTATVGFTVFSAGLCLAASGAALPSAVSRT